MLPSEAVSALDAKQSAERSLAAAAQCPPWRHALFGAMMGALVASPAIDLPYRFIVLVLILAVIPVIIRSDRKRTGVFVNGYRRGRTRLVAFAMLALILAIYSVSVHLSLTRGDHQAPLLLGLLAAGCATAGSVIWQRVFVRELGA